MDDGPLGTYAALLSSSRIIVSHAYPEMLVSQHVHCVSCIETPESTLAAKMLKTLLARRYSELTLLVGNGVNRHGVAQGVNSWDQLLSKLAREHLDSAHKGIPTGISLTEFYDVVDLAYAPAIGQPSLQRQFCNLMNAWRPLSQHIHITDWARKHDVPLLTTNFDNCFGNAAGATLRRPTSRGFTAYYPWSTYYGTDDVVDPCGQFAVWHVNGMQRYRQSIRLGLSHYMGSVERARSWLHKGERRLFNSDDPKNWTGSSTWLQVLLHKSVLIIGLGLSETEVFLRWLLIERARYFRKFPARTKRGWYVHLEGDGNPGRALFLNAVGITSVPVASYEDIYAERIWRRRG